MLTHSSLYSSFQKLLGASCCYSVYINEYVKPLPRSKILDIGCGTSEILDFLPQEISYTGYDLSAEYTSSAANKYGNRGRWFCSDVADMDIDEINTYDIVMANGLFHHLSDTDSQSLSAIASKAIKQGGKFCSIDACYMENQNPIARYIIGKDRGQNVRYADQYASILFKHFSDVQIHTRNNLLRIPYAHTILIAGIPKS